jgi:hypothetical protein
MPLNQAVETFYSSRPKEEQGTNGDVERAESSLRKQEEIIKEMQKEEAECRVKGDFISGRIDPISNLIKSTASKKMSDDELKAISKEFKVKRIDRAKRVIIIETDDSS